MYACRGGWLQLRLSSVYGAVHASRKPMRGISWSPSPTGQLCQRFVIKHRAWIGQGVAWPPFCPCGEKIVGAELSERGECQVFGTPLASSKQNRGKIDVVRGSLANQVSDRPAGGVSHCS